MNRRASIQRVVHVVGQLDMGGMEKLLADFARHADRERFELRFICLGPRGVLANDIEAEGWPVESLGHKGGRNVVLLRRLAGLFREWRPDVVHTHNSKPLAYAAPAARLARVPRVIHTRHGQAYGAGNRQLLIFRWLTRLVDKVVCVSADSARISRAVGVAPKRIQTILNGIDVVTFDFLGPQADGPIVAVGRICPEKNFETLLRAVALARREYSALRLEIAGDGPNLPSLRTLAAELGVSDCVRFLGQVRDVPSVLARASAFVLPSLTEGVSLTLLEAMARGLPVIATNVGGNPEVVVDGETGLLVPAQAPERLAQAILDLLRSPNLGRRMGLEGRRRVEQHFDVQQTVSEYERLYADSRQKVRAIQCNARFL